MRRIAPIAVPLLLLPAALGAQSLAGRLRATGDGTLHLAFAAWADVCGGGRHGILIRDSADGEWEGECERGPVRASLGMRGGRVVRAKTWVGGRWRQDAAGVTDLGTVAAETRGQAVFWLGQAAGREATRGLDSIARDGGGDLEIRKQAVFALSQRPADEGVPALISIARANRHPEIIRSALFWLGQSDDPRALALFEEILR